MQANRWPSDCSAERRRVTFELRPDGSGMFVVTRDGDRYAVEPLGSGRGGRWSPDGTRLAFVDRLDGRTDVVVRELDGFTHRVTDDDSIESNVRWTADGTALLFDRVSPSRGIWLLRFE